MLKMNYKKLKFYLIIKEIIPEIYNLTREFPDSEQGFTGIVNQIRRAIISSISNIAEGSTRKKNELIHFLLISLGSLREVSTQLEISYDLGYINKEKYFSLNEKIDEAIAKQYNFIKMIKKQSYED